MQDAAEQVFDQTQAIAYCAVWLLGTFASFVRTINDDDYRSVSRLVSAAVVSGFTAVAFVSLCRYLFGLQSGFSEPSLFISLIVGLVGKESDKGLRLIYGEGLNLIVSVIQFAKKFKKVDE